MDSLVRTQLAEVKARIQEAQSRSPHQQTPKLLAVSKTWPVEHIQHAIDAGHRVFAENKVQEAESKIKALAHHDLEWHFIGRLQRNKVRKVITLFDCIHSFDSLKLLEFGNRVAEEEGKRPQICLQINLANEEQKGGFSLESLTENLETILSFKHLEIIGLMIIPPAVERPEEARTWFSQLRDLRTTLSTQHQVHWPELSMGMSQDYLIAIEEGSTLVRVGSAIFGSRKKPESAAKS